MDGHSCLSRDRSYQNTGKSCQPYCKKEQVCYAMYGGLVVAWSNTRGTGNYSRAKLMGRGFPQRRKIATAWDRYCLEAAQYERGMGAQTFGRRGGHTVDKRTTRCAGY